MTSHEIKRSYIKQKVKNLLPEMDLEREVQLIMLVTMKPFLPVEKNNKNIKEKPKICIKSI